VLPPGTLLPQARYTLRIRAAYAPGASTGLSLEMDRGVPQNHFLDASPQPLSRPPPPPSPTAFAQWSFSTNAPPRPGSLTISPRNGYSLDSSGFSLRAANFADDPDDLPLAFTFKYASPVDGREVLIAGPSLLGYYAGALLPPVSQDPATCKSSPGYPTSTERGSVGRD
jgi:hypothetical protein